ncbi:unnamed protein product [Amoebophrya sp. A120]|nr:unnamed protein product [Amoebophrya sp. A120]|eukprot:GSA120T00023100001.1
MHDKDAFQFHHAKTSRFCMEKNATGPKTTSFVEWNGENAPSSAMNSPFLHAPERGVANYAESLPFRRPGPDYPIPARTSTKRQLATPSSSSSSRVSSFANTDSGQGLSAVTGADKRVTAGAGRSRNTVASHGTQTSGGTAAVDATSFRWGFPFLRSSKPAKPTPPEDPPNIVKIDGDKLLFGGRDCARITDVSTCRASGNENPTPDDGAAPDATGEVRDVLCVTKQEGGEDALGICEQPGPPHVASEDHIPTPAPAAAEAPTATAEAPTATAAVRRSNFDRNGPRALAVKPAVDVRFLRTIELLHRRNC